jgi:RNA polymerase sigma factor (TIGR02999 family)
VLKFWDWLFWMVSQKGKAAADSNVSVAYEQLRQLARNLMRAEQPGHTLQATALVHEAYLKLVSTCSSDAIQDRSHFLALAIRAMRQVLVDHARARRTAKRGGGQVRVELRDAIAMVNVNAEAFLELDEMISELSKVDGTKARVFEMSFILGFHRDEIATALGLSEQEVKAALEVIRAWARHRLGRQGTK